MHVEEGVFGTGRTVDLHFAADFEAAGLRGQRRQIAASGELQGARCGLQHAVEAELADAQQVVVEIDGELAAIQVEALFGQAQHQLAAAETAAGDGFVGRAGELEFAREAPAGAPLFADQLAQPGEVGDLAVQFALPGGLPVERPGALHAGVQLAVDEADARAARLQAGGELLRVGAGFQRRLPVERCAGQFGRAEMPALGGQLQQCRRDEADIARRIDGEHAELFELAAPVEAAACRQAAAEFEQQMILAGEVGAGAQAVRRAAAVELDAQLAEQGGAIRRFQRGRGKVELERRIGCTARRGIELQAAEPDAAGQAKAGRLQAGAELQLLRRAGDVEMAAGAALDAVGAELRRVELDLQAVAGAAEGAVRLEAVDAGLEADFRLRYLWPGDLEPALAGQRLAGPERFAQGEFGVHLRLRLQLAACRETRVDTRRRQLREAARVELFEFAFTVERHLLAERQLAVRLEAGRAAAQFEAGQIDFAGRLAGCGAQRKAAVLEIDLQALPVGIELG